MKIQASPETEKAMARASDGMEEEQSFEWEWIWHMLSNAGDSTFPRGLFSTTRIGWDMRE